MTEKIISLTNQAILLAENNPLIAGAIVFLYVLFLWKKPGATVKSTLLIVIMSIVGLWFWQMFDSRNSNKNWKKGDQKTFERVEKAIKDVE